MTGGAEASGASADDAHSGHEEIFEWVVSK